MLNIQSSSSSSCERVVSLRFGVVGDGGASTSGTKPPHEPSQLTGPVGLRVRRPTAELSPIGTPDSQTLLLSNRTSPGSPLSDHLMASRLHHLVKGSMGGVEVLSPDVEARLVENVGVMRQKGFDTPEKVQKLLKHAWRHDAGIAVVGLGLTGNAGVGMGMELANEKLVAKLPPRILRSPSLVGMLVGLGAGGLDVLISTLGKATMIPLLYNGAEVNGHLPASVKVPSGSEAIMESMKLATSANFLKNAPRIAAPAIQALVENQFDGVTNGSIVRQTADRVDLGIDVGLGFAASSYVQFKNLTGGLGFYARMLLRDDLGDVIDKMGRSYKDSAIDVVKSVGSAVTSPAVPLAVTMTIGLFISELFAANSSIDHFRHAAEGSHGHLSPERADWSVMTGKRASSVMLMALMTAAIEVGAPIVGAAAQAATDATVGAAGKAKKKISGAATSALDFISAGASHVPDIGGWVVQRLGLQAPAPAPANEHAEGEVDSSEGKRAPTAGLQGALLMLR